MAWATADFFGLTMKEALTEAPDMAANVTGTAPNEVLPTDHKPTTAQVTQIAKGARSFIRTRLSKCEYELPITYTGDTDWHDQVKDIFIYIVSARSEMAQMGVVESDVPNDALRKLWLAIGNQDIDGSFERSALGLLCCLSSDQAAKLGLTSGVTDISYSTLTDSTYKDENHTVTRHASNPIARRV